MTNELVPQKKYEEYAYVLDFMPHGKSILIKGREGSIIQAIGKEWLTLLEILALNNQMQQWFPETDVSKKPICYKTFNNPPRERVCSYCPTFKTLQDGKVHESITDTPQDDKIIHYRIISSPLKDQEGKITSCGNISKTC